MTQPPLILKEEDELAKKLQEEVRKKLITEFSSVLPDDSEEILPEYVKVLVCNKKTKEQIHDDLVSFLEEQGSKAFCDWLWKYLTHLGSNQSGAKAKDEHGEKKRHKTKEKKERNEADYPTSKALQRAIKQAEDSITLATKGSKKRGHEAVATPTDEVRKHKKEKKSKHEHKERKEKSHSDKHKTQSQVINASSNDPATNFGVPLTPVPLSSYPIQGNYQVQGQNSYVTQPNLHPTPLQYSGPIAISSQQPIIAMRPLQTINGQQVQTVQSIPLIHTLPNLQGVQAKPLLSQAIASNQIPQNEGPSTSFTITMNGIKPEDMSLMEEDEVDSGWTGLSLGAMFQQPIRKQISRGAYSSRGNLSWRASATGRGRGRSNVYSRFDTTTTTNAIPTKPTKVDLDAKLNSALPDNPKRGGKKWASRNMTWVRPKFQRELEGLPSETNE